jgi:hypothetical protein
MQRYQVVYERAKWYLVFNAIMLLLSPLFLLTDKVSFIYAFSLILATNVCTAVFTLASRLRISCVEAIFPVNCLVRGLISLFLTTNNVKLPCLPTMLDFTIRNFNQLYCLAEVVLFWTNVYSLCVTVSAVVFFLAVERSRLAIMAYKDIKFCGVGTTDRIISAIASLPIMIPSVYALYMQTINEIRLFLTIDNMRNQQRMTLEMMEKQNEAVVLIQPPKDGEERVNANNVLYSNKAFKEIISNEDENGALGLELL